jgi:8-oxo-dGTP pyrophosphatase MutT (NUDIX family)
MLSVHRRGLQAMTARPLAYGPPLRERAVENFLKFTRRRVSEDRLTPAAVALTLVGTSSGEAAFIITRRPGRLRRHGGQWAIPGGRADHGERPEETARREVEEEIGLKLTRRDVLGQLDDFPTRSGFVITPVVLWGPAQPVLRADPSEVASVHLVPLRELDAPGLPLITPSDTGRPLISFAFETLGTTVWAPTAAMLYQMREVVLHGRSTRVAHFEQPRFAWR